MLYTLGNVSNVMIVIEPPDNGRSVATSAGPTHQGLRTAPKRPQAYTSVVCHYTSTETKQTKPNHRQVGTYAWLS